MPRPTPRRAIMPISVTVEGDTAALVPDLCHELARELSWGEYGESIIPADAAPRGVITDSSGEHVYGGLLISLDPNQPSPPLRREQRQAGRVGGAAYPHPARDDRPGRPRHVHQPAGRRVQRAGDPERHADGRRRRGGGLSISGLGFVGLGVTWRY